MLSEKKYKLVPPDGGWGYLVGVGIIFSNVAIMGFIPCFGIIYKDLIVDLNMNTQFITTTGAILCIAVAVSGFFASSMMRVMSKRKIMLIGAVAFNIGSLGAIFTRSKAYFVFILCVQYVGAGFLVNLSFTVINDYFLEKKVFFMTLTQAMPSLANMLSPLFVEWLREEYGFRGTMMIISCFSLQVFVAAFLLQPVEWHMKKVEIKIEASEEPLMLTRSKELTNSLRHEESRKVVVSFESKLKNSITSTISADLAKEVEAGNIMVEELPLTKKEGLMRRITTALNLHVFKNFFVVNACICLGFCSFSDQNFVTVLPQALYSDGWDEKSVAWAISLFGFGDIFLRLLTLVFSALFARIGVRVLYMMGLVIGIVSRLAMLWSDSITAVTTFITISGMSHCTISSLSPLVLSEIVTPEEFPAAVGASLLTFGFINLLCGPAVGAVRDLTNSYATTFYILTSFLAIVLMFWLIESCYMSNQRKLQKKAKGIRVRT